ncbi:MAG: hypothetical protein IK130_01840 [Oscillospiraceae bacterium]|nr:hypothetical protein [Oscillospiraceae bacterium]
MSTKNYAQAVERVRARTASENLSGFAAFREALRTKNAQRLLFAIQFVFSFLNIFFLIGVVKFAYYSCFYRLDIPEEERAKYCVLVSLACIGWGILILFTRRQILTRLIVMISMPLYLPILLFNYRYLCLIIPFAVFILITYLGCGTSEGPKTIFGAVFLMIYLLGAFAYFVMQSVVQPPIVEKVLERDESPEHQYRYSVVEVRDQANGNTYISIEPNTYDIDYSHSKWYAKGYAKQVYRIRPSGEVKLQWKTQTRAEITKELLSVNPSTVFTLNSAQMKTLGMDKEYKKTVSVTALKRSQRKQLGYCIETDLEPGTTAEAAGLIKVESTAKLDLTFEQCESIGLTPSVDRRLSTMTDEDLAKLGVPEINEVLMVNGKPAFRQYVAVIEHIFEKSFLNINALIETNDVPEIGEEVGDAENVAIRAQQTRSPKNTMLTLAKSTAGSTTETTANTTVSSSVTTKKK